MKVDEQKNVRFLSNEERKDFLSRDGRAKDCVDGRRGVSAWETMEI